MRASNSFRMPAACGSVAHPANPLHSQRCAQHSQRQAQQKPHSEYAARVPSHLGRSKQHAAAPHKLGALLRGTCNGQLTATSVCAFVLSNAVHGRTCNTWHGAAQCSTAWHIAQHSTPHLDRKWHHQGQVVGQRAVRQQVGSFGGHIKGVACARGSKRGKQATRLDAGKRTTCSPAPSCCGA